MLCACGWGGKGLVNVFGAQSEVCCVSCRHPAPPPGVAGYELLAQGAAAPGMPGSAPRGALNSYRSWDVIMLIPVLCIALC